MTNTLKKAVGALNFNSLPQTAFDSGQLDVQAADDSQVTGDNQDTDNDQAVHGDQNVDSYADDEGGFTQTDEMKELLVKDLSVDPSYSHVIAKSKYRKPGEPLEQATLASLFACYKVAIAREGKSEGDYIPLSKIWRGIGGALADIMVGWRGTAVLVHKFEDGQPEQVLDKCVIYKNGWGASNSDIIFHGFDGDKLVRLGIQCRDTQESITASEILVECRKSLAYETRQSPHYMTYLIFLCPSFDFPNGTFPKLYFQKRRNEDVNQLSIRRSTDEAEYEFYKTNNKIFVCNGRGLISRLWLDFAVDRPLEFYYHDDGEAALYPAREKNVDVANFSADLCPPKKRQKLDEEKAHKPG